jgi:hypothetical protein
MHHSDRKVIEHHPIFGPTASPEERRAEKQAHDGVVTTASHETATREQAELRALNGPPRASKQVLPLLHEPVLPKDFEQQVAALDQAIYERGFAISRDRLLSLGKERFRELLAKDGTARSWQRFIGTRTDLTSWPSVEYAFQLVNGLTTTVPRRKMAEEYAGSGLDREAAGRIASFSDLWKVNQNLPTVRDIYAFHDGFVALVFGASLLERLSSDGRVRSHFFCGGSGPRVSLFQDWLDVLEGPHFRVVIAQPLFSVLAWLTKEQAPLDLAGLAHEWFGVRAPSRAQLKLCEAVTEGFLLGYRSSWDLWDRV